jgi:NAD(P) transhydrogenase subunit beta
VHTYLYIAAAVLFILGIKLLGRVRSARRGNRLASLGMVFAVVGVLMDSGTLSLWMLVTALAVGTVTGSLLATRVQMTAMPELVAAFNGLGGGASALVALAFMLKVGAGVAIVGLPDGVSLAITVPSSIMIGVATLTGSAIAYLKLAGKKILHPVSGPFRNILHILLGIGLGLACVWMVTVAGGASETVSAMVVVALSGVLGVFLVMPIGGADMPVVVALLNSLSGVAAAASGFVLQNSLLIVSGALVGASGLILTRIMCKAMNRSLLDVLVGGIGDDTVAADAKEYGNIKEASTEEVAMLLDGAGSVIIVPGYGLAVAQAQHTARELGNELQRRGTRVSYAIHPVAGRMPGHMNVLLAEADVPYEQLFELDQINGEFQNADVSIVVGANDVVNPVARQAGNPISGMPILDVDASRTVVVIKRSLSPGYAGVKNPLFEAENCLMVFEDAKGALQGMVKELKGLP